MFSILCNLIRIYILVSSNFTNTAQLKFVIPLLEKNSLNNKWYNADRVSVIGQFIGLFTDTVSVLVELIPIARFLVSKRIGICSIPRSSAALIILFPKFYFGIHTID